MNILVPVCTRNVHQGAFQLKRRVDGGTFRLTSTGPLSKDTGAKIGFTGKDTRTSDGLALGAGSPSSVSFQRPMSHETCRLFTAGISGLFPPCYSSRFVCISIRMSL